MDARCAIYSTSPPLRLVDVGSHNHTPDRLRRNRILSSLGRAYPSDPQGFVLGSSRSNFPGWSPILGLLQPPTRLTSEFPVLRSQ
ncbi:hypothetical protein L3X38_009645 [Prunus dulcis]|uniref:Uncharacterized protein n=1 Tax=Prunus dulcis TaxID=3755 RepID=A0AAD4ZDA0_PRUDU|nr:hypothetical protein L3X38_009645 [Prunus dulcis]